MNDDHEQMSTRPETRIQPLIGTRTTIMGGVAFLPENFEGLWRYCVAFYKSGLKRNNIKSPEQWLLVLSTGLEAGFTIAQAARFNKMAELMEKGISPAGIKIDTVVNTTNGPARITDPYAQTRQVEGT